MSGFLEARRGWLRVETMDRPGGCWDVVVVIDGTYVGERVVRRDEAVRHFEEWIKEELYGRDDETEGGPRV